MHLKKLFEVKYEVANFMIEVHLGIFFAWIINKKSITLQKIFFFVRSNKLVKWNMFRIIIFVCHLRKYLYLYVFQSESNFF